MKTWRGKKPITKIFLAFSLIAFLVLSFFGFKFLSNLIAEKKAEKEKYLNCLAMTKSAPSIVHRADQIMKILENTQDDFEGTGIVFSIHSDILHISEVMSGSPADKAELKASDRIVKIDGKSACGMSTDEASAALRGRKGTKVELNIYRDSSDGFTKDFVITRDLIDNSERREYLSFLKEGKGGNELGDNYMEYKDKVYYFFIRF